MVAMFQSEQCKVHQKLQKGRVHIQAQYSVSGAATYYLLAIIKYL